MLSKTAAAGNDEGAMFGVMLHVFGTDDAARQLYSSAGYLETNVIMLKRVDH